MPNVSKLLLLIGIATIIYLFYLGSFIAPEVKSIGMFGYIDQQGWPGGLLIFSFSFAFPFALLCIVLAGLFLQQGNLKLSFLITLSISFLSMLIVIWPFMVGSENSRWYFMIGGSLLLLLILSVAWFWAQQRNNATPALRKVIDLRGLSYFFFALATWNSCGAMGMPGYALYPERSIAVNAYPLIIGQVKVIMLYFILAWLCLAVSYVIKRQQRLVEP